MNCNKNILIVLSLICLFSTSCEQDISKQVFSHYKYDKRKKMAASFLLGNIKDHYSISSAANDSLINRIKSSDSLIGIDLLNYWWSELARYNIPYKEYDTDVISAKELISDIDLAFDRWNQSPWRNEINFSTFCHYILPYRVFSENLSFGWRDSLYKEYSHLIMPNQKLEDAFRAIHMEISQKIRKTQAPDNPFLLNAMEIKNVVNADCLQYCLYECYVMRALGIPVAIDGIYFWTNYGKSGHSWIALIKGDGTYTINRYNNEVKRDNPIDASIFKIDSVLENNYQYSTDFKKKCSKIWRRTYDSSLSNYDDKVDKTTYLSMTHPSFTDVSDQYGLCKRVKIETDVNSEYAYLCTYRTTYGWTPIAYAKKREGMYIFENLGDSAIYLPMIFDKGVLHPIGHPIRILAGRQSELRPYKKRSRDIKVSRKYPLVGHFVDIWSNMKGAVFEGSNSPTFEKCDVLYKVNRTPIFRNSIDIKNPKKYQYVRLKMSDNGIVPLAEMELYSAGKKLSGEPFGDKAEMVENCFDGDTFTIIQNQQSGYVVGLKFEKPRCIDQIVFYLKNDGNFVIPNDVYELFYYDKGWVSLGKKKSGGFSLTYTGVPDNALLLLKNQTRGEEERIFTFDNGQQIWW